jgi:hypothetical protein
MNWWGVYAVPVGVAICFGPVLIAWAIAEWGGKSSENRDKRK